MSSVRVGGAAKPQARRRSRSLRVLTDAATVPERLQQFLFHIQRSTPRHGASSRSQQGADVACGHSAFPAAPVRRRHRKNGTPSATIPTPSSDWTGRSRSVFRTSPVIATRNSAGTQGYPKTR